MNKHEKICEVVKGIQNSMQELDEASELLKTAANYGLTVEVVVTALHAIVDDVDRYKDNPVLALKEACEDWDV